MRGLLGETADSLRGSRRRQERMADSGVDPSRPGSRLPRIRHCRGFPARMAAQANQSRTHHPYGNRTAFFRSGRPTRRHGPLPPCCFGDRPRSVCGGQRRAWLGSRGALFRGARSGTDPDPGVPARALCARVCGFPATRGARFAGRRPGRLRPESRGVNRAGGGRRVRLRRRTAAGGGARPPHAGGVRRDTRRDGERHRGRSGSGPRAL